jgi:hypothetical protein
MESNRARDLAKARRIWRRFVDAGDPKRSRTCACGISRQSNHAAHRESFRLGELTGDEDVSWSGFLCRRKGRDEPQSKDG